MTACREAQPQYLPPVPISAFDVERIRADFPILSRTVYGKPLVYLDNAASAQKPRPVLEAIRRAYEEEYANVHRGLHFLSNTATQNFEDARESVRRFLNAPAADQIVFTRNATEAINLVAQSFGGLRIGEGDEIVLSIMEHHSNIVPWHFHRERNGAVIKWAPVDDDGNFLLDEFEKLLGPRTRMVAITHMSNALGTIVPVKEVIRLAHARGIPVLVDGSQAAVHMPVDVADLDCDFYVFTGHKAYGPTGVGALYAKPEHLAAMPPYQGGGEMIREVFQDEITYGDPPHRFEAGTPAIVQAIGLGAALDYMDGIGREAIAAHEAASARLCRRAAQEHQFAENSRPGGEQGRDHLVHHGRRPPARHRHRDRPPGRGGAGRHPLHHAAARALRADRQLPGLVCHVQHPRGGRSAGRGIAFGPTAVHVEDIMTDTDQIQASEPSAIPTGGARPHHRRHGPGAQDRLRPGDPGRHFRAWAHLQDRHRRRPQRRRST
jgi:cysteine desulfurase / selenocysteine lyase